VQSAGCRVSLCGKFQRLHTAVSYRINVSHASNYLQAFVGWTVGWLVVKNFYPYKIIFINALFQPLPWNDDDLQLRGLRLCGIAT
jgi:hypothetical protein